MCILSCGRSAVWGWVCTRDAASRSYFSASGKRLPCLSHGLHLFMACSLFSAWGAGSRGVCVPAACTSTILRRLPGHLHLEQPRDRACVENDHATTPALKTATRLRLETTTRPRGPISKQPRDHGPKRPSDSPESETATRVGDENSHATTLSNLRTVTRSRRSISRHWCAPLKMDEAD